MKNLLKQLGLDAIVGLDWETYYSSKDYSLRKMATTDYIVDERFKAHMVSVQRHDEKKTRVFSPGEFKRWAKTIDWRRTGLLAHHTAFDALIASHHFNVKPAFYLDTLSMARPVMPVQVGGSLKAVCAAFGRASKKRAAALENVDGVRDLTPQQYKRLAAYAGDDIEDTWFIFKKLLPYIPLHELRLIDLTIKMYAQPTLRIDTDRVRAVHEGEVEKKAALLKRLKLTPVQLSSNPQFAALLEGEGVVVPTKVSKRTRKKAPALSVQDLEFKALARHPKKRVRDLIEARKAIKSTITETRSERMAERSALGAVPVYLNYYGAKTGRWSGADKMNWQNLTRGSEMRKAIHAPEGHVLIVADQAQIEARINAWFAGQDDVVAAFANRQDVYKLAASKTYGKPVEQITKDERFVGKVQTLALGYQAGGARFAEMLRIGAFGPPLDVSDQLAKDWVAAWRQSNNRIVWTWKETQNLVKSAFIGRQRIEHGCVAYEGAGSNGYMHLPGGMTIRYDGVDVDEEGNLSYVTAYRKGRDGPRIERTKIYGGLLCIAEGTLVLTNRGWKPIEHVAAADLVHDGFDFVAHSGVVFKGADLCVEIDGVGMTKDHEVLTHEGWVAALEEPRPLRPYLWGADCAPPSGFRRKEDALGFSMSLWERDDESRRGGNESCGSRADTELRLPNESSAFAPEDSRDESAPGIRGVAGDARSLPVADAPSVAELRSARHRRMQSVDGVRDVLARHGSDVPAGPDVRAPEQQPRLFENELLLGDVGTASSEPPRVAGCGCSKDGVRVRHQRFDNTLSHSERVAGSDVADSAARDETRRVYDIVDCGPNKRFVVAGKEGPLIVHNCENRTQALARTILAGQMVEMSLRLPKARLATTTHDEVVLVVRNAQAERALRTVVEIMTTPPEWAAGLPFGVDAKITEIYDKG